MREDLKKLYQYLVAASGFISVLGCILFAQGHLAFALFMFLVAAAFTMYIIYFGILPTHALIEEEERTYPWPSADEFARDLKKLLPQRFDLDGSPLVANIVAYYRGQFSKRADAHEVPEQYQKVVEVCEASLNAFLKAQMEERSKFKTKSPFGASFRSMIGEKKCQEILLTLIPPFSKAPDFIQETLKRYRNDEVFETDEDIELYTLLERTPHHVIARGIIDTFNQKGPLPLTQGVRFEHMHILAGSGWGKTQTLQRLIMHDLASDAALIVIDSQEALLDRILHLKTDREIIYIDPTDATYPAAINPFDISRLDRLPDDHRERFLNNLIQHLEFVFAGLLKAELTQKQNVLFRYSLRVMLACEGTNLLDLVRFMEGPEPYLRRAKKLPIVVEQFFDNAFKGKHYTQTMVQIAQRLYGVLENDTFLRMLTSQHNLVNLKDAMERGAIVLVDTNKSHLGKSASSLLGRYFIALTLQAALERGTNATRGAFLYVDEAGEYFDENVEDLLTEARKHKVGVIIAHQKLQDFPSAELRSAVAANTSIKLAGGGDAADARWMADNMRTNADFIHSLRKTDASTEFACFIRNEMPTVKITVPFFVMENAPKISELEYDEWHENNRRSISEGVSAATPKPVKPLDDEPVDIRPVRED